MYESSFRLRGKTYDYKIQFDSVKKFMVLPKPDDMHTLITVGLDPPLRQGQTRYPFLVMQFDREEEITAELNMEEFVMSSDACYSSLTHGAERKLQNTINCRSITKA